MIERAKDTALSDTATHIGQYEDHVTGEKEPVDLAGVAAMNNGIELQHHEVIAATGEGREPNNSVHGAIECCPTIGQLA